MTDRTIATKRVADLPDLLAPDGSEIRLLPQLGRGSMVHCRLPVNGCTKAVTHRSVEELWYVLAGQGELWRAPEGRDGEVVPLAAGVSVTIPLGIHFQFRNTGSQPLDIVIVTMPPWPDMDEAYQVRDHWPVD